MSRCRSCEAPIEWALTPKGARIPLDVGIRSDGNIVVDDGVARVVPAGEGDRVSHFATCRDAAKYRRHPSTRRS